MKHSDASIKLNMQQSKSLNVSQTVNNAQISWQISSPIVVDTTHDFCDVVVKNGKVSN